MDIVLTFELITFVLGVRRFFLSDITKKYITEKKSASSDTKYLSYVLNNFFSQKNKTKFKPQLHYLECMMKIEEGHINRECSCKN